MDRLLTCDLSKAKLQFYDSKRYNIDGYDELYVAVFDDMTIEYFHEFYDCELIVKFSDKSCMEYSIERGNFKIRYWHRFYTYVDKDTKTIDEWDGISPFDYTSEIAMKIQKLDCFVDDLMVIVTHWKDNIRPNEAAALIQAAFRGWQVRHAYRYNPGNCLGRHLVMKMFEEVSFSDHS